MPLQLSLMTVSFQQIYQNIVAAPAWKNQKCEMYEFMNVQERQSLPFFSLPRSACGEGMNVITFIW